MKAQVLNAWLKAAPGWPQATFFTATGGEPRNKIAMV